MQFKRLLTILGVGFLAVGCSSLKKVTYSKNETHSEAVQFEQIFSQSIKTLKGSAKISLNNESVSGLIFVNTLGQIRFDILSPFNSILAHLIISNGRLWLVDVQERQVDVYCEPKNNVKTIGGFASFSIGRYDSFLRQLPHFLLQGTHWTAFLLLHWKHMGLAQRFVFNHFNERGLTFFKKNTPWVAFLQNKTGVNALEFEIYGQAGLSDLAQVELRYSNFKLINDVVFPYEFKLNSNRQKLKLMFNIVKLNEEISFEVFQMDWSKMYQVVSHISFDGC